MVKDNRNLAEWPSKRVIIVESIRKHPHKQRIVLECGHWLHYTHSEGFNVLNNGDRPLTDDDFIRCRQCALGKG